MENVAKEKPTKEAIAQHYKACMDSVNLIKELKKKATLTDEDIDSLNRNQGHLSLMVADDFWGKEDLKPLRDAAK